MCICVYVCVSMCMDDSCCDVPCLLSWMLLCLTVSMLDMDMSVVVVGLMVVADLPRVK